MRAARNDPAGFVQSGARPLCIDEVQRSGDALVRAVKSVVDEDDARGQFVYDELARLTGSPIVRLNRVVAVGEADGPRAGLAALAALDDSLPRHTAVAAYLRERNGGSAAAARLYAEAACEATNLAERDRLTRQAARLNVGQW